MERLQASLGCGSLSRTKHAIALLAKTLHGHIGDSNLTSLKPIATFACQSEL